MRSVPVRGPLTCPRDNAELRPFRVGDVHVDTCHTCTGVWLDAGELGGVAHDAELEAIALAAQDPARVSTFACPRCAGACHPAVVEEIELDVCTQCRGIWLDANELHQTRVRLLTRHAPPPHGLATLVRALAVQRA